jgi:hypothetical protein
MNADAKMARRLRVSLSRHNSRGFWIRWTVSRRGSIYVRRGVPFFSDFLAGPRPSTRQPDARAFSHVCSPHGQCLWLELGLFGRPGGRRFVGRARTVFWLQGLVINTGTTIVTFLMVFLIQSTQNRDALAIHIKLDELLPAVSEARTGLMNLEDRSDEELQKVKLELAEISNGSDASTIALGQPGPPPANQ